MLIGKNCFKDTELRAFFDTSGESGICAITKTKDDVVDIAEIQSFLSAVLSLFVKDASYSDVSSIINQDWDLFSSDALGEKILKEIPDSRSEPQSTTILPPYISSIARVKKSWADFKEEIRWKRRYLVDKALLSVDAEWDRLLRILDSSTISSEQSFFRSRIHDEANSLTYRRDEMGAPPKDKASSGRANPEGIPYLYLCEQPSTTLYEVRALYLDDVSVGKFKLKDSADPLKIADFTTTPSLFGMYSIGNSRIEDMVRAYMLHQAISSDLSKPIRRYDSSFEYIPTQFICEYMRYEIGLDGIKYYSALRPKEVNIVIFDPSKMECVDVKQIQVNLTDIMSKPTLSSEF
ncbi:RES family NAD+ phosphorylase [Prevotella corporis]|jgi:hypothetical protein|uniref:RES family NAD+ phosphorylase n=1 Tax=Prevotella corporis TaxID=28128 RepID=UPI00040A6F91|nr:RES family NAD+ phosphorylase [Prevotella corporis]